MADTVGIKMARAYPAQIDTMRKWFQELEEMLDDETKDNADIGLFVSKTFEERRIDEYERILFGYETLFDNACDPNLSYLAFKPEIAEAITERQSRKAEDESRAIADGAKSVCCPGCGELKTEEKVYCTKCGTQLPSG